MTTQDLPVYQGVADALRHAIDSGELAPGDPLPSEHDLAERHGISRTSVRTAFGVLAAEGLITQSKGRVRRVRQNTRLVYYASRSESIERRIAVGTDAWVTDVKEQGHEASQTIMVELARADADIARWLELEPGTLVAVRRRIRSVDGTADNINDTYYPMDLAQRFPEIADPADVPQGIIRLMRDGGVVQVRYCDELTWRPPTQREISDLAIPTGVAVLVQARIGYTADRPVKCTVTVWPGHTHTMVYELSA